MQEGVKNRGGEKGREELGPSSAHGRVGVAGRLWVPGREGRKAGDYTGKIGTI